MRRLVLVALALVLAACAADRETTKPEAAMEKEQRPLYEVLRHKNDGEKTVKYEDRWFAYEVELHFIGSGGRMQSAMFSACPVATADYRVLDKETGEVVREETVQQMPCDPCHKR